MNAIEFIKISFHAGQVSVSRLAAGRKPLMA